MRSFRAFLAGSAALLVAACASAEVVTVYVHDFEFTMDPTLTTEIDPVILVGDTVRWEWVDLGHNAKSVNGSAEVFDSGFPTEVGATFDHTFTNTGTFWYYCTPHGFDLENGTAAGMAGTVTVVPEPASVAAVAIGLLTLLRKRR